MRRRSFLKSGILAGAAVWEWTASAPAAEAAAPGRTLRLNANENPRGVPPAAREAVRRAIETAGRYPFQQADAMAEALARKHRAQPEQVALGNGSSEILQMTVQALCPPGGRVVMAEPTFESAADCAAAAGLETVRVPLRPDHSHDLPRMREAAEASPKGTLVYICNPNNPTATLTPAPQIEEWLKEAPAETAFLVDEAYFDYVGEERAWSAAEHALRRPNLVVTRTFSKVYGMAGLRLGYGLAHEETAKKLRAFASDINTNALALAAGLAALGQSHFRSESVQLNAKAKQITTDALRQLGLQWIPSHTNFLMHEIRGDLKTHIERMKEAGILVGRPFPPLLDHCRVSIGLPKEMERFGETLGKFRKKGWV